VISIKANSLILSPNTVLSLILVHVLIEYGSHHFTLKYKYDEKNINHSFIYLRFFNSLHPGNENGNENRNERTPGHGFIGEKVGTITPRIP
jgi:hypothetical protein